MVRIPLGTGNAMLALAMISLLSSGSALADKPAWAGGGNGAQHEHRRQHERRNHYERNRGERHPGGYRAEVPLHGYFGERRQRVVHEYYEQRLHAGHCPPGLAKKHNGCMPPGHAKRWAIGSRLPRGVTFYNLPPRLVVELGTPPAGYRYVRVASDILLITVGTGMVVDAIHDLTRR